MSKEYTVWIEIDERDLETDNHTTVKGIRVDGPAACFNTEAEALALAGRLHRQGVLETLPSGGSDVDQQPHTVSLDEKPGQLLAIVRTYFAEHQRIKKIYGHKFCTCDICEYARTLLGEADGNLSEL